MKFQKITALITAACFLTVFTGQSLAQAVAQDKKELPAIEAAKPVLFSENFGKITETKNYNSPQVIINIQDLHAHPQTQKNIASILQALDEKYTVKRIYSEGASGKVDVSWLYSGNNYDINPDIVSQMVENGALTGAEYFTFLNKKDNLFGLEDASIHHQNIARLGALYENEAKNLQTAANIKGGIDYLANKYLNREMKDLSKASSAYHGNETEAAQYYKTLLSYADKINKNPLNYSNAFNLNPENFAELKKVVLIDEMSKKLNAKHVNSQLQKYMAELKDDLSVSEFHAFMEATDNLNDIEAFFKYVSARGFDMKGNSQLASFIKIKELNSQINPLVLFEEEQRLEEQVRRALASSEIEREISFLNDFYIIFEGYLTNKLTAKDEEYFKRNFNVFGELYEKYSVVNHISEIKDQFSFLNDYYNVNNKRNEIFIEKIDVQDKLISGGTVSAKTPEYMLNDAKEIIIMVTGGYHTHGISEILSSKNISHITITPKISESTQLADVNYRQIIMDQSRIYREALSFVIASQTADPQKFKILVEAGAAYLGKDISFDNIDGLIDEIDNIIGGEGTLPLNRIDENTVEIKFKNGASIVVGRGENNEIIVKRETPAAAENIAAEDVRISDKTVLDAYFGMAKTLIPEAFKSLYRVAVLDVESDPIYQAAKDFFVAKAAEKTDFGVDGEITALEDYARAQMQRGQTFDEVKKSLKIDGISYEDLSTLPEYFQKEALSRQINKDMSDKGVTKEKKGLLREILKKIALMSMVLMLSITTLTACGQNSTKQKEEQQQSSIVQQEGSQFADVNYVASSYVDGDRIMITDQEGKLINYIVKGICYSRDRDGLQYYQNYKKDLPLLQELGVNSIRTYRPFAAYTNGAFDVAKTKEMLDAFQDAGITVTVGFSYEDMKEGALMDQYLKEFGDHPAILTIALGNEYNYHYDEWFSKKEWMSRLESAAGRVKKSAPNKIIAVVHGEMPSAAEVKEYKDAGIQLIMLNMYRGEGFTDAAEQWKKLDTDMPWVLGEFGRSSKARDGSDTSDAQVEFLTGQIRAMNMGYIFSAFDEAWKGAAALNDAIGAENSLGIYKEDGSEKPVTIVVKEEYAEIAGGHDGYYLDDKAVEEEAPAPQTSQQETQTQEGEINFGNAVKYGDDNWRAYALNLGVLNLGENAELVLEIETDEAASNSGARIELRNLDDQSVPVMDSNIVLPETYKLAEKGGKATITIPRSAISSLNFNQGVELVISTGKVFEEKPLNTEIAEIAVTKAFVRSADLELPFFSYILNKLGITKREYPKTRAALIAALEAPFILILPQKWFLSMHGKNTPAVELARKQGLRDMKAKAVKNMAAGAAFGAAGIVLSSAVIGLFVGIPFFGVFGVSAVLSFALSLTASLSVTVGIIAGLISVIRSHLNWNLANLNTSLDNNVQINVIYAKSVKDIYALQEKYGRSAVVNPDGTVSQNVFIVGDGITVGTLRKFSNSGLKVDGKTVKVMQSDELGIVYHVNNASFEDIASAIQNEKLEKLVSRSLRKEKIFLGDTMKADYLEIDPYTKKTGVGVNDVTGAEKLYLGGNMELLPYDTVYFGQVRDMRNAEGWQRARSIMIFLDKVRTLSDLERYIKILKNASNGNLIITEELAQKLVETGTIDSVLEQLRKDGISIMVEKTESSVLKDEVLNLFDGRFDSSTGKIETAVAGEGRTQLDADMILDADTLEDSLLDQIWKTAKNIVIYESAIEEYVESDRSGLGKFLEEITSVKILKYFTIAEITAESAKETGRNFDIERIMIDFNLINSEDIKIMYDALQEGMPAERIFLLSDNLNVKSGARMYLEKIDSRVEDPAAAAEIKKAYMEGLFEKLAAAVEFKNAGRVFGFKNKNTEKLVGQLASFKYMSVAASETEAAEIREKIEGMTARNYNNEIVSIVNEKPQAIPLVADLMLEMIFLYEDKVKLNADDFKAEPDIKKYEAILAAA